MYYRNWAWDHELESWAYVVMEWKNYTLGKEEFVTTSRGEMRLQELIIEGDQSGLYVECAFEDIPMLYETKEEVILK